MRSQLYEQLRQLPQPRAKATIGAKVLTRRKRDSTDPRYHSMRRRSKRNRMRVSHKRY